MQLKKQQLIDIVIASMNAEKDGDIAKGLALLHKDFQLIDIWQSASGVLMPRLTATQAQQVVKDVFPIQNRQYHNVKFVADEQAQTVAFEFIETYPDPETSTVYCTPQVGICQIKDGKIWRTRHYCDPRLSAMNLNPEEVSELLNG